MSTWMRQLLLLTISGLLSWWVFLYKPTAERTPVTETSEPSIMDVIPILAGVLPPQPQETQQAESEEPAPSSNEPAPPSVSEAEPEEPAAEEEIAALPPELGTPEGAEEIENPAVEPAEEEGSKDSGSEEQASAAEPSSEELMEDPALLALADAELGGETQKGFATVFLAAPEDQLAIAKFFGEELVLVPRSALDPEDPSPSYFHLTGSGAVGTVSARPSLEEYRQYRDLFDYEYARLPSELRALRRSVLARNEVYLFAALIPRQEWAVVIAIRGRALELAGRKMEDVKRFVIRYVRRSGGGFDFLVEEIRFADGSRFRPEEDQN